MGEREREKREWRWFALHDAGFGWCVAEFAEDALAWDAELDFAARGGEGVALLARERVGPLDAHAALGGRGGEDAGVVEGGEDEAAGLGDAAPVGDALAGGLGDEAHEGDAEGVLGGEVADLGADDAGGEGRDAAGLVHGLADLLDVLGLAAGSAGAGIAAEGSDVGLLVLGGEDLAGADGDAVEAV